MWLVNFLHAWFDTGVELAILVYVYHSYKKECRAVEMAEKEFAYDEEWNKKMLAREVRREKSKKAPHDPFDLKEMD